VPFIGLIKNLNNFDNFSHKNEKIVYTRNGKDTPNIQIGITSFLYKILTQSLRESEGFRSRRIQIRYLKFQAAKEVTMTTKFGRK